MITVHVMKVLTIIFLLFFMVVCIIVFHS